MTETYANFEVTVDESPSTTVTTITSGVVSSAVVLAAVTYVFTRLILDTDNNILTGFQSNGVQVIFAPGAELSVALIN